ncbi:hypothetical protein HOD83_00075 [Candidatus Woesearchaeota archaeon]|nr:hypothetical protein [Candidatus Woesearchaeota archaeon]
MADQPKKLVGIGIGRYTLISYSPKLSSSELVKFHYALLGRGKQPGLLRKTHSIKLANSVILAPKAYSKEVLDFLRTWKCNISTKEIINKVSDEKKLQQAAKKLVAKRRDISDVLLVDASLISKKAKSSPVVCLLTHSKTPQRIAQNLQSEIGLPVIFVQADQLFTPKYSSIVDALKQGTSLITSKTFAPKTLFVYSTKHIKGSDKVRFFYDLKGRGKQKGIIESTRSEFFAKSVIIAPSKSVEAMQKFLTKWKCQYEKMEVAESV